MVFACNKFRTYILGFEITVRSDHKSISFLQKCKLSHGRLTRWILALQEYHITWEYVPGKQNTVADALSRVNLGNGTFEVDRQDIGKIYYHILACKEELADLLNHITEEQIKDTKLTHIKTRIQNNDMKLLPYYQIFINVMYTKPTTRDNGWKLYIPKAIETQIITIYHQLYGHMGPTKVIKALEEHVYIKGINRKVRLTLRRCGLCQKSKNKQ